MNNFNLDHAFIALADPTRRSIVQYLGRGEARVTDIASRYPLSLNSVSKHIRMLERARLVKRRKVGREHLLTLQRQPLERARLWIEKQEKFWSAALTAMEESLGGKS